MRTDIATFDENLYLNQYTKNLEDGMIELKEKLNSSYERLDASR